MGLVVSLYRYPIKGFRGENLQEIMLRQGEGIPGDRIIGITRGQAARNGAPFHQLTTNPDLVHYKPETVGNELGLVEAGKSGAVNLFSDMRQLRHVFGAPAEVVRREDGLGHWDFDDSMLSIINISTVAVLSAKVGMPMDPMRFRANIYIEAEPFSEFKWLGGEIQVGDACLSIIRPIKRCSATSVNPGNGQRDINTPAQLNRHFGHIYCGVYAQVERSGKIKPQDRLVPTGIRHPARLATAASVPKAPPVASWPRPARVAEVTEEAPGIRSLWLEDPLAALGSLDAIKPGQHIALHGLTQAGDWRRYMVSSREAGRLRITVKRDAGLGSQALHQLSPGQVITMTGPFGPETLNTNGKAMLFLSAGIGITPTITKLKALAEVRYTKPVRIIHAVRHPDELALWNEVKDIAHNLPGSALTLHLTGSQGKIENAVRGRPDIPALMKEAAQLSAEVHVCGPGAFQSSVASAAGLEGIYQRLFMDSFASPNSAVDLKPIPPGGPFSVTFKKSGMTAQWRPENGSLLDFAESKGLVLPAHCRAGLCQTCACEIVEGQVFPLAGQPQEQSRHALLCCAVPSGDITLDC